MSEQVTFAVEARDVTPAEAVLIGADLMDWGRVNGAGEPATLDLAYPLAIKRNGQDETIDRVALRRPTADDVIAVASIANEDLQGIRLVERCAMNGTAPLPTPLFKRLDATDLRRLAVMLGGFQ